MNYEQVEENLRGSYRRAMAQYRRDDEIEVTTRNHSRLCRTLQSVCLSFSAPIRVLEVGCGTGRYFHCLRNVTDLTGIDISEDMLAAARDPVCQEEINVGAIHLLQANAYLTSFDPGSFHFIYCLGMFGHGCPVTAEICNAFWDWLKPGGKLLFNAVDATGLPATHRIRRRVKQILYPWLGRRLQAMLDERESRFPFFAMQAHELEELMSLTRFESFSVTSYPCESPLWEGRHLQCLATKS